MRLLRARDRLLSSRFSSSLRSSLDKGAPPPHVDRSAFHDLGPSPDDRHAFPQVSDMEAPSDDQPPQQLPQEDPPRAIAAPSAGIEAAEPALSDEHTREAALEAASNAAYKNFLRGAPRGQRRLLAQFGDPLAPSFVSPPTPVSVMTRKCSLRFALQALGLHEGDTVHISLTSGPAGGAMTAVIDDNPASAIFAWDAAAAIAAPAAPLQRRHTSACFSATDSRGLVAQRCVGVVVEDACFPANVRAMFAPPLRPTVAPAAAEPAQAPVVEPRAPLARSMRNAPSAGRPPPPPLSDADCVPLFYYSNADLGDQFFTTNFLELGPGRLHYKFHPPSTHVYALKKGGTLPVRRYYNDKNHRHVYAVGAPLTDADLTYEGVAFYLFKRRLRGLSPVYLWVGGDDGRGCVFSPSDKSPGVDAKGFRLAGVAGYGGREGLGG
jgi:hypothetical protein